MKTMKIVVTDIPKTCEDCLFSKTWGYDRCCEITRFPFNRIDIDSKTWTYDYTRNEELCPLISLSEALKQQMQESE